MVRTVEDNAFEALYEAIFSLGNNFLQQGQVEKALIIFDGLIALLPNEPKAAVAYGETLLLANRADHALNHFYSLSKQFDVDSRTLLLTAKACVLLEKPDEAKKLLTMITAQGLAGNNEDRLTAEAILSLL